ncbi:MAG: hypothetical protein IJ529_04995 [Alphaproteobacteria bacterium]|nr:hypothetical protein [Alphaproteobacteria bacterium]MBQ9235262.1 hypothetical protein [Alphaproteobacteria bacterium]
MTEKKSATEIKMPIIETLLGPFGLLFAGGKYAVRICATYALMMSCLMAVSGNMSVCFNGTYRIEHFCADNVLLIVAARLIYLMMLVMFTRCWIDMGLNGGSFSWKKMLLPNLRDVKILGLLAGYLASMIIAGISFYLLYIRVPNPDWRIELAYFALVSIGFLAPLMLLRFGCYIAMAALGEKMPKISDIWRKTSYSPMLISAGAAFMMMAAMFVMMPLTQFGYQSGALVGPLKAWVVEYMSDFIICLAIALVANFCYLQRKNLLGVKKNDD